jgi:hypothetical protein
MDAKPHRRWYQFSLRTMFVGMTLACVVLAWVGYSLNWIRQRQQARGSHPFMYWHEWVDPNIPLAPDGLWLFGEKSVFQIESNEDDTEVIRKLFPEAEVLSPSSMRCPS